MSLQVQGVWKSFRQAEKSIAVLKGVNFELQKGQVAALLGQSGSGKSTLLTLMAGLDRPDEGQIRLFGTNISGLSQEDMTRVRGEKVGIVFQQFHLMPHLTAVENVQLPLEIQGVPLEECRRRAQDVLAQVGLGHRELHFAGQLSGGECQRVAIARALVTRPQLLLADEPSGNLDQDTGEKVLDVFVDVVRKNGITTCVVTHSVELASRCDVQFRLNQGVV